MLVTITSSINQTSFDSQLERIQMPENNKKKIFKFILIKMLI